MNFLNFLTAGASLFNFNLQNLASSSISNPQIQVPIPKTTQSSTNIEDPAKMKHQIQFIAQKQQLINQYMHLNIQLLSQKLESIQKFPIEQKLKPSPKQDQSNQNQRHAKKKNKKIIKCGHDDKQHYAKGLCNNCYHKFGRTKKPTKCPHQKLYAAGMCQNCYINSYNRKKRSSKENVSQIQQAEVGAKIEQSNIQIEPQSQKQDKQKERK